MCSYYSGGSDKCGLVAEYLIFVITASQLSLWSCRLMKKVTLTYVANNINIIILYIVAEAILYDEVVTKTTNMSVNFRVWNNDDEVVKAAWVLDAENVQVSDKFEL